MKTTELSSDNRLLNAVIDVWESGGNEVVSARQVSANAAVPVSSIYHHFGSLEQLLVLAQEQAQACARDWCETRLDQLAGFSADARAFAPFFAATIDDWVHQQRRLAFAWREGQMLRIEGEPGMQMRLGWRQLWAAFWQEACDRFGLGDRAWLAEHLFENESFVHMIGWHRAVDRAGLDEFARGVSAWMSGEPVPPAPWRDFARTEALRAAPVMPSHDGTTSRIAAATAALIEEAGPSGVTHRAVAERTDLTLGVVSHKLRTKTDLLQAGYEAVYLTAVTRLREHTSTISPATADATLDGLADFMSQSLRGQGVHALHLAVARDPALRPFGLQLRYLRGMTSGSLLAMLRPDRAEPSHLEAALLSSFLSSLPRMHADDAPTDARPRIRQAIESMVSLL
ncbi:putative TetR family transcriptional regulator [Sphingobium sp. SYK-6]|nr:putative TetR family transcriptional regulator [Sphingobium sp. SYK-6]